MELELRKIKIEKINYKLNFLLKNGKINVLIGQNGSGKSLILKTIAGINEPLIGNIYINNVKKQSKTLKYRSCYVSQNYNKIISNITVKKEINSICGLYKSTDLDEYLNLLNLDKSILEKNIFILSSSERKKIVLIANLLSNKKILLFDNIDAQIDYKSQNGLIKILKKLKREDKIIVLTTNNMDFALEIADNIIFISKSEINIGDKYKIFKNKKLLNENNLEQPKIIEMINYIKEKKDIKLMNVDNMSDFIKDLYRNVKKTTSIF